MKKKNLFITSLVAAATMSVPALAAQPTISWDIDSDHAYKYEKSGETVSWKTGSWSNNAFTWNDATGTPARGSNKGFVLYFDGTNQTISTTVASNTDTSDGGGIVVTGTGNTVTATLGRWAGNIQVDAGNTLNTSWSTQLKDGKIVASGTVNITSGNLNLDGQGQREWFVGSEGSINFATATGISNGSILLTGEVNTGKEIENLTNREFKDQTFEKQLVSFNANEGISVGLDSLTVGTISSTGGTALTSAQSKENLQSGNYFVEKTSSGVKIYYAGKGYEQKTLTWAGTSTSESNVWENTKANWTETNDTGSTATSFLNNDKVVFDTGTSAQNVSIASAISADTITVKDNYTFTFTNDGSVSASTVSVDTGKTLTFSGATSIKMESSWTGAFSLANGATISAGTTNFASSDATKISFADASGKLLSVGGTCTNGSITDGTRDLSNVSGAGTISFAAVGNLGGNNGNFSRLTLGNDFTGTLEITSGVLDMLAEGDATSPINTSLLGGATKIELKNGGLLFRNTNNTTGNGELPKFDKEIVVGTEGGAIRVYGNGNVTLASKISGTGTLQHTDGGTLTLSGEVNLGGYKEATGGRTNISGNATFSSLSFGNATSVLNVLGGGTLTLTGHDALGYGDGSNLRNGTVVLQGTDANSLAKLVIDDKSNNVGASLTLSNKIELKGYTEVSANTGSSFNSFGGTVVASGTNNTISSAIQLRKAFTVEVTGANDALTVSGAMSVHNESGNVGSFTKTGAGTLTLSGANTYTAGTTVSAGTLVAANASALGTGAVTVNSGAKLQINAGTKVSVGTTNSTVTLASGAKLVIDFANPTSTQTVDGLTAKTFEIMTASAFSVNGTTLSSDNISTTLTSDYYEFINLGEGMKDWVASWALSGNTLSLTMTVPEPSMFGVLAGLGALALAGSRRRRRAGK